MNMTDLEKYVDGAFGSETIHYTTSIMVNAQSSAGKLALTFLEGTI
jgi:hypothetical protein